MKKLSLCFFVFAFTVFSVWPLYGKFFRNGKKEILTMEKIGVIIPITVSAETTNTNQNKGAMTEKMHQDEKAFLKAAHLELTRIQSKLKKRKIHLFSQGIRDVHVSMPVDSTALWLGTRKKASMFYKAVRSSLKDSGLDAVLMFIPSITSVYKNNGYQYWYQKELSGQFVIKKVSIKHGKVYLDTLWTSKKFLLMGLEKPDFKHGKVKIKPMYEMIADLTLLSNPDKISKTVRKSFTDLKNLGADLSFFMNFGASLGMAVPDKDYLKTYNNTLSLFWDNSSINVFFMPSFYIDAAFRLNKSLFLGFSLSYLLPFNNKAEVFSGIGETKIHSGLNGFYPALYLGWNLKHKGNSLTLLSLEPGVLFGTLNQSVSIAGYSYKTELSGTGFGVFLGLEYIEHADGDFDFGTAGFTYSIKFSGGISYINQFSSGNKKAYIQNNDGNYTLYLSDGNSVLPNSKLMDMFNYYIGIQVAIGFGL